MKLLYYIVFYCFLQSIECKKLLIFKNGKNNVEKYITLFNNNGMNQVDIITDTIEDRELYKNLYDGFIIPGGDSNITDVTTKFWGYVNFTLSTDKPVFAICLGFQHVLKYYFPRIIQTKCEMYNVLLDGLRHNHKWCVPNKYTSLLLNKFDVIDYYTYNKKLYIGVVENDKIIGTIFHPEKQSILTNVEKRMLERFYSRL